MLVGREVLLQACERALEGALRGKGRLVLLAGEAGIGKTTLATAITDRAMTAGAVVRVGACWETEGLPPFTPWLQALRHPHANGCEEAAEQLGGGDHDITDARGAERELGRRFADVAQALRDEAEICPQVVLLEDLHWADGPSLDLLTAVAAHLPAMGVLVIGTYRPDELARSATFGAIGGNADRLSLGGLDVSAVAEVLQDVLGREVSNQDVLAVQRQTSGNPLFVTQVARLLDSGSPLLPAGVRDILERRLARMSTDCDRGLGAAAVLGPEFDEITLAALLGESVGAALDEAAAAGLVLPKEDSPGSWRFVHALVQATRYERLGTSERAELHRAALHALYERPRRSTAALAHHATRGRFEVDDHRPAQILVAAGQEALDRLAWGEATASFERALAAAPVGDVGDAQQVEAWLGIGAARLRQGSADVRTAFDEAASLARRIGRGDLLARAALGFGVGLGGFEVRLVDHHQIDLLEEAAAALIDGDRLLPLVLARLSVALAFVDSSERRTELAERAIALARAVGEPVVLGHALAAWCDAMAGPTHVGARAAAAAEIVVLADRAGDLPLELLGRRLRVVALLEGNEHAQADQEVAAYERAAARFGDPLYAWYGLLWRGMRAHARGELAEAARLVAEAAVLGAEASSVNAAVLTSVLSGMTAIDRRERRGTDEMLDQMLVMMPTPMSPYLSITRAFADALFGNADAAGAALAQVSDDLVLSLPVDSEWVCSIIQIATAASRVDDRRLVALVRPLLEPVADLGGVEGIGAYVHGSSRRFLALLTAVQGDAASTRDHVEAAQRAAQGGGALLEALAGLDGAWALQRAGDPDDLPRASAMARSAAAAFTVVGLSKLAQEAASLVAGSPSDLVAGPSGVVGDGPSVRRRGDVWAWTWEEVTVQVRHAKGVADLALLLERNGREVHVRELEGLLAAPGPASAHDVLDATAVQQYRQRLQDIEEDLDEADRFGDVGRAAQLAAERDALVDQLTSAFGLGGRPRQAGSDPDERLRKAVSARVRASIERIGGLHPALGNHLRRSVRTGFWCSYQPEQPTKWQVERA